MENSGKSYRMSSDIEPSDDALMALMHEVAVEAKQKADSAMQKLRKKIKVEISEALIREGYQYP